MSEYEIYVPICSANGGRIASSKRNALKKAVIKQFGGLTEFPQKQRGFWKVGEVTFRDQILIWRVLSTKPVLSTRKFWSRIKKVLAREWRQEEVLIVRRKVSFI